MKLLVTAMVMLVSLNSMAATALLKSRLVVGFAPEEYRGVFTTTVLSNGVVEYENNKGQVKQVLKLSKVALKNLAAQIEKLEVEPLMGEDTPQCMDAPSSESYAVKAGKEVLIKTVYGCREKTMNSAYSLVSLIQSFDNISDLVKF
jgi:hypothetical protein